MSVGEINGYRFWCVLFRSHISLAAGNDPSKTTERELHILFYPMKNSTYTLNEKNAITHGIITQFADSRKSFFNEQTGLVNGVLQPDYQ